MAFFSNHSYRHLVLFLTTAVLFSCQGKQGGHYSVTYQVTARQLHTANLLICYRDTGGLTTVCIRDTSWTKQVRLAAGAPSTLSCRTMNRYPYSISRLFPDSGTPVITARITRPDACVAECDTMWICLTLPAPER